MRILFLDDDLERHDIFGRNAIGHDIVRAYDAKQAIDKLADGYYDKVYLDHDLGGVSSQNRLDSEQDGRVVTRWIAANAVRFAGTQFYVHSFNYEGAREMCVMLHEARLRVYRHLFSRDMKP